MSVFKFKKFSITQEKSAMKVGTDGVLLGSWASCEKANTILDIGCGTGLIALMLGQRNLISNVTGIEIDKIASQEAQLNISNSDWEGRIEIKHISLQQFTPQLKFDLIVSNRLVSISIIGLAIAIVWICVFKLFIMLVVFKL